MMSTTKISSPSRPVSPKFTDRQRLLLRKFHDYSLKHEDEITKRISENLKKDDHWHPIIKMQSQSESHERTLGPRRIRERAILENDWDDYINDLLLQGRTYASLQISYTDWKRVVQMYRSEFYPIVREDFKDDFSIALDLVEGMNLLTDFALSVRAFAYFDQQNASIRESNKYLEEVISVRTSELRSINEELESFTYTVSHDLRAPLRAIDGFSRVLLEDYGDKFDDQGKMYLEIIKNNVEKMGQLIDDLLTLSRIGRHDTRTSDFDPTPLIQNIFDDYKQANPNSNVSLTLEPIPRIKGDQELLKHVFTNLIDNAIKYSSKEKEPKIKVCATVENGETVIAFSDNGVGFDMEYADKMFGIFERLHSVKEFDGTGVGLAIAKRIIQKHDGEIWADSSPGNGATFYFKLSQ